MLLIYVLTGFAISLISVPVITSMAEKANIVDRPSERKIHHGNIPLLGGLGIFLSYIAVMLIIDSFSQKTYSFIAANIIIIALGVADDILNIKAVRKLAVQIIAATVIIVFTDLRFTVTSFDIPFLNHPYLNIVFTYLWIVGVTNALNLIDGLDGLAGGIAFMAFGAIGYAAYAKGFEVNAYICMGLMGATLGFLRYNIPPAKVFMGDTGSLFLGFNIAVMSLAASHKSGTLLSVLIPVMFISIPLFDTVLAVFRRTMKGQNPMKADKEHLHHRLLDLQFSSVQTLMIFYSLSIVLMVVSIISFQQQLIWGAILVLFLLYGFLLCLKLFHLFEIGSKIRRMNERMRIAAYNLSKKNSEQNSATLYLDVTASATTVVFMINFIWKQLPETFPQLAAVLMCIIIMSIVLTYRHVTKIKNEFAPFIFFWVFFYVVYLQHKSGFTAFDTVCFIIIFTASAARIAVKKQFDLFVSNPMELITLFCLFLIYLFAKVPFMSFFTISAVSLMLYYANKFFVSNTSRFSNNYTLTVSALIVLFMLSGTVSVLRSTSADMGRLLTPGQVKTSLKSAITNEDYTNGRKILLEYESKNPFRLMKVYYQSEGAKVYYNLIVNSLMEGDLNLSDLYLYEFLTMFPDLAYSFYEIIKPLADNLTGLKVKGTDKVYVHNVPLKDILSTYAATVNELAGEYASKGYEQKSVAYRQVAGLVLGLVR